MEKYWGKHQGKSPSTDKPERREVTRRQFLKTSGAVGAGAGITIFVPNLSLADRKKGPIHVGLLPPLTGVASIYGKEISQAGELAVEMINEAGGVLGRKVKLFIQDDGTMPNTAVPAAERLVKKYKCVMICGDLMSNSRIAVDNQVAEPLKIVMNNFSFYEGSICGRYFFHMAAVPNQQIDRMIPWMLKKYGKRFYFVGDNYEWPRGSIAACKAALKRAGGKVVGEEYNPIGTSDFSSMLMRIKRAKPDVVVPYEAGTDQDAFLKQFTAAGLKKHTAVVMGHYDEAMMPGLKPEVRKDFYSCNTYFMTVPTPENKKFLARLRKKFGKKAILTNFGEAVAPCMWIWAKGVAKAGTTNPSSVVRAQEGGPGQKYGLSVKAPSGKVTVVKQNHHCVVTTYLTKCQANGTFKILETWPNQEPVIPKRYGGCVASVQYGCRPLKKKKCPPFPGG